MNEACDLKNRSCIPCKGGVSPLPETESRALLALLDEGWKLIDNHHIERRFTFPDFAKALAFTNKVGEIAERQGHHPDIELGWGRVKLILCTHKINGLTENDFILAAKADSAL